MTRQLSEGRANLSRRSALGCLAAVLRLEDEGARKMGKNIPQDGMHLFQLLGKLLHEKLEGVPSHLHMEA